MIMWRALRVRVSRSRGYSLRADGRARCRLRGLWFVAGGSGDARMVEIGDLLFCVVNLARRTDIDPERALRAANRKFERRFQAIEARLAEQGRRPEDCTLAELDALWDEVKKRASNLS